MEKEDYDKMINELAQLFVEVINENDLCDKEYASKWNKILDNYNWDSGE